MFLVSILLYSKYYLLFFILFLSLLFYSFFSTSALYGLYHKSYIFTIIIQINIFSYKKTQWQGVPCHCVPRLFVACKSIHHRIEELILIGHGEAVLRHCKFLDAFACGDSELYGVSLFHNKCPFSAKHKACIQWHNCH